MGIDGHLRNLPCYRTIHKKKSFRNGVSTILMYMLRLIILLLLVKMAQSPFYQSLSETKMGQLLLLQNLALQICHQILASFELRFVEFSRMTQARIRKICSFIEENKFDEEAEETLLDIYFENRVRFSPTRYAPDKRIYRKRYKNNSYHVLIDYMNPLTGKVEIVKMQLSKGKPRRGDYALCKKTVRMKM